MSYLTMNELLQKMQTNDCTAHWDVVVSYSVTQLDLLLQKLWVKNDMHTNLIAFNVPLPGVSTIRYYVQLTLSSPSLQFSSQSSGKAQLTFDLVGFYRVDNVTKDASGNENVIPGNPVDFPIGAQMIVSVPIAGVTGNQSENPTPPGKVISLDSSTTSKSYLIFHFANAVETVWKSKLPNDYPEDQATLFNSFAPFIKGWFSDPKHIQEIDIALAQVSNDRPADGQTSLLIPSSFIFTTQSEKAGDGVLSIWIQVAGSGRQTGSATPGSVLTNNGIFPIPSGYHSSIIFSHELISNNYIAPQLTTALKSDQNKSPVSVQSFDKGFLYNVQLAQSNLVMKNISGTDISGEVGNILKIKFTPFPLQVDNSYGHATAHWNWKFNQIYEWSLPIPPGSRDPVPNHGKFKADISLSKVVSLGSVVKNELQLGLTLKPSDFDVLLTPLEPDGLGTNWGYGLPCGAKSYSFDFTPVDVKIPHIDFFCTTNILAPGQHVITIDATQGLLIPYDCLLVGQIMANPTKYIGLGDALSAASKTADDLLDECRRDDTFLGQLISKVIDNNVDDLEQIFSARGYNLVDEDFRVLDSHYLPGDRFDVRAFGGAYRPSDGSKLFSFIFVDSINGSIYMDGEPVMNLKIKLASGSVTFTANNGSDVFQIKFQNTPTDLDSQPIPFELAGTHWPLSDPSNTQSFTGQQFFPLQSKEQDTMHLNNDKVEVLYDGTTADPLNFWSTTAGSSVLFASAIILGWPGQKIYEYISSSCCKRKMTNTPLQKSLIKMQADLIRSTRENVKEQVKKLDLSRAEKDVIGRNAHDEAKRWLADNDKNISDPKLLEDNVRHQLDISIRETVTQLFTPRLSKFTKSLENANPAAALDVVSSSCEPRADDIFNPKRSEIDIYIKDAVAVELKDREWQESKTRIEQLADDIKNKKVNLETLESEEKAAKEASKDARDKQAKRLPLNKIEESLIIKHDKIAEDLKNQNEEIMRREENKKAEEQNRDIKEKEKKDKEKKAEKSRKEAFK